VVNFEVIVLMIDLDSHITKTIVKKYKFGATQTIVKIETQGNVL